jgi:hypothetical protein
LKKRKKPNLTWRRAFLDATLLPSVPFGAVSLTLASSPQLEIALGKVEDPSSVTKWKIPDAVECEELS